jgi:hypothetical protein
MEDPRWQLKVGFDSKNLNGCRYFWDGLHGKQIFGASSKCRLVSTPSL